MSEIVLPIYDDDGFLDVVAFDRDSLSPGDLARADMYLDTLDYHFRGYPEPASRTGPGGRGGPEPAYHSLEDFEGAQVGGYQLVTSEDFLDDLINEGEINPAEDHSQ